MPTPGVAAEGLPTPAMLRNTSRFIEPEQGGTITLSDGAEVVLPPGAVSGAAMASLRVDDSAPAAPSPRNIIGRAYQFGLDGGDLTGIARVRLPVPPEVSPDQYELAVYSWNGRAWERISSRLADGSMAFGTNLPGLFAVQGRWKPASATITLAITETEPGQETIPITATGQYRYSSLPLLQNGLVPARLTLKRDSSGGAGQVTGNESLDQTVAETALWFQPDPTRADGSIPFSHLFELDPSKLDVPPGSIGRFYTVLTVDDSAAPTRQFSTAVEHPQVVPIRAVGSQIIRPRLADETSWQLRWHVKLNDQTLLSLPASGLTLPLGDILAQGGIGDYRIVLEAESNGAWIPASNEVAIQLKLPGTPTPLPGETPPPGAGEIAAVEPGATQPASAGPPPPTPTRRSPPSQLTAEPTPDLALTVTAAGQTVTATPTRPAWAEVFWADRYAVAPGACTIIHWSVQGVNEVYLDDGPVTGAEARRICPTQTTTYNLRTVSGSGTQNWYVTINVQADGKTAFDFAADNYLVPSGQCVTLRWQAIDVRAVYLDEEGVPGVSSRQVCPTTTTTYTLRVESSDGTSTSKPLTISVVAAQDVVVRLWAERYTLPPGECTQVHWSVLNVQEVHLAIDGEEEPVTGESARRMCPTDWQYYTVRAVTSDGKTGEREIWIEAGTPTLGPEEVIAQAVVANVSRVADLNPNVDGDQPGWNLALEGLNPLFRGNGNCCQTNVTLKIPQDYLDQEGGQPLDWPISARQQIEFRAGCTGGTCTLESSPEHYVRLTSG